MVKIPETVFDGPPGRRAKAGDLQKNPAPGAEKPLPPAASAKTPVPLRSPELQASQKTPLNLARTLGLPRDGLSLAVISFARHFSLPLNPGLLAKIRRMALEALSPRGAAQGAALSPRGAAQDAALSPKGREGFSPKIAVALAAAAAAGKGAELSPGALETYAAAADPEYAPQDPDPPARPPADSGGAANGGGSRDGSRPGNGDGADNGRSGGDSGAGADNNQGCGEQPRGGVSHAKKPLKGERLREEMIKIEEQNPLLGLLNRLPGKKGERWIVFPFTLAGKTLEFRVSLRILLRENAYAGFPGRLALDISGGEPEDPVLRWLFIYDKTPGGEPDMKVHLWPPEQEKTLEKFRRELSGLLGIHPKQIELQNDGKLSSFAADCRDNVLPSINKQV